MDSGLFQAIVYDCLHVFVDTKILFAHRPLLLESEYFALAKCITAQAGLESSGFTSFVYKKNNNCFGMKYPRVRSKEYILSPGTSAPKVEGSTPYCAYATIYDSVYDLLSWLVFNKVDFSSITDLKSYVHFLGLKFYYGIPESQYYKRTMAYYNLLKPLRHA